MEDFIKRFIVFFAVPLLVGSPYLVLQFNNLQTDIHKDKISYIYSGTRLDSIAKISNKIIIIGGSNLLFGIDKYLLERELKRPVFSLAHVRTDGTENMLRLAKGVYKKDDIILISLEYGGISKGSTGYLLDYYLSRSYIELFKYFFKYYIWYKDKEINNPNYNDIEENSRNSIYNSFNNDLFLVQLDNQNFRKQDTYVNEGIELGYSKQDVKIVQEFIGENTMNIFGIHPILCKQKLNEYNILQINRKEIEFLPIRYITEQENYLFDSTYIFDYSYHLNRKGREIRTLKLVQDIKKYFLMK